ncbi:MAG: class I SAM-dependent methyltransferase [Fluviicoccus sp.]|uniref:class I SAM-dependent DNA methyltransferase n=1 Tax=Fluviicoccus sp. TaxID=2003552 RepID=UPI0027286BEA|nr:class I SAM-dependent methyltransferase [Fluviicoccus sp.]MDO8330937.1 class I SAM-dependent methyltransferase [Fluviicoccus sp.]
MQEPTAGNLYADLSGYYDGFCHEVDYAEQGDFLRRAFDCLAESTGKDYLDLACGTGQLLQQMHQHGFAVAGLDNSPQMLEATARRCPSAALMLCDLASFDGPGRFDLISCFLYSIHYSHPVAALTETVNRAFQALKPGGVFLFDLVDKNGINNRDAVTRLERDHARFTFRSGWRYDGCSESMVLQVAIRREDANGVQDWEDRHRMTAITIAQVNELMRDAGFVITLLERDFARLREWEGDSFNVIMAGRKP